MEHENDDDASFNWYTQNGPKGSVRRLKVLETGGRQGETIQTTVLERSARKLRRDLET